ncbi:hypothetical protein CSKR_102933 [Clonorchis sinensis]|uniref:Uncharacterized protein n=1 Tax=Clonorchis sinensis TaxID=79923 RepID=A0A3R7GXP6_CLOSI|nr:hypothetical protein CSKR_102933 [Clonorchis sinensis]
MVKPVVGCRIVFSNLVKLRILIRTVLDPAQIKDAERIGALYSLLHSALCTQEKMKISHMKTTECNNMQQLTTTMAGNGRQVNVVYQTVLNYDHRKLVKFLVYHVSITPTVEIAFPEKWKVGLQGVIDSLGLALCNGANFQVPLFHDQKDVKLQLSFDQSLVRAVRAVSVGYRQVLNDPAPFWGLAVMPPEGSARAEILSGCPSLDRESREAKVAFEPRIFRSLEHVLPVLVPGEFHCFPYSHVYGYSNGMFSRIKAFVPKTSIQTPRSSEYSDLALVELLKSTRSELSFSLYTHKNEPAYGKLLGLRIFKD